MAAAPPIGTEGLAQSAPGTIAPKEGPIALHTEPAAAGEGASLREDGAPGDLGPNNERLEELKPRCVAALRQMIIEYRMEGIVSRRHEIRRIRQARLFWQGLQYGWWNPNDMSWHLPFGASGVGGVEDAQTAGDMPRYQFVTNFYQGFGLSFIAIMSQDVPTTRFYRQSTQSEQDLTIAKAAHHWNPARAEWSGGNQHHRRPRIPHSGVGERDARIPLPAMAAGSASRQAEGFLPARGRQDRDRRADPGRRRVCPSVARCRAARPAGDPSRRRALQPDYVFADVDSPVVVLLD